ncbi:MAG: hypothetical protein AB8B50_05450 [Pirellulaceae bacterium]
MTQSLSVDELMQMVGNAQQAENSIAALLATLQEDDEEKSSFVGDVLREVESIQMQQAGMLQEYCLHATAPIAAWACQLVPRLQLETEQDIEAADSALTAALETHLSVGVRQQAAKSLGRLAERSGRLSTAARSALQSATQSGDPRLSRLATRTLEMQKAA